MNLRFFNWSKKEPGPPKTFEEAVNFVCENIEKDTVNKPGYHNSGGMGVRNDLGLWDKNSPLYKHMQQRFGICHADDTGALISAAADAKINGRTYDPAPDIQRFKEHWRRYGYDAATMEKLPTPSAFADDLL